MTPAEDLKSLQSIMGSLRAVCELTAEDKAEMAALLNRHFEGVTRAGFERDLSRKNWTVMLRARGGGLVGFSTLLMREARVEGESLTVIYSGDTIMDPAAWRSAALPREWIGAVNRLRGQHAAGRCYWLLLTSGMRTYRLLSTFWREFYPRAGVALPEREGRLLEMLAREEYGAQFDAASGIVRLDDPQRLRAHLREIPAGRLMDSDVAFFVGRNRDHAAGDELVCLCEIAEHNLTRAGRRMVFGPERCDR